MTFISIVPYNRELLVIKDMDVFTSFFCYARRQKKGLVSIGRPSPATDVIDDPDKPFYGQIEDSEDILP